jgi:hypothetical protein
MRQGKTAAITRHESDSANTRSSWPVSAAALNGER